MRWIMKLYTGELRAFRSALVDRRCHTKSCDSAIPTCLLHPRHRNKGQEKMGKTCLRTSWALHWVTVNQQHMCGPDLLESQQTSVFCIWTGCTALPHPVSAKWQHPFFPMKHGEDDKTRNRDLPPEGHLWQRESSHAHLETTSETFELATGKVCATLSLAQHIWNWEVRGSILHPAQHLSSQPTCGFIRWEKALKPLLSVQPSGEIWLLVHTHLPSDSRLNTSKTTMMTNKKKRLLNKSAPKPFKKLLSWRV